MIWPSFGHHFPICFPIAWLGTALSSCNSCLWELGTLGTCQLRRHFSANPPQHAFKWGLLHEDNEKCAIPFSQKLVYGCLWDLCYALKASKKTPMGVYFYAFVNPYHPLDMHEYA